MAKQYNRKQKKSLHTYFRCLSSACIESNTLPFYFTNHEFTMIRDRWLGKRFFKKVLYKCGNIENAQDLKQQINWFLNEGVHQEFEEYRNRLSVLSETARTHYIESSKEDPDYGKLYQANSGLHTLPPAGVLAHDLAWSIYLCRIGRRLGYLTKEEAWDLMIHAAKLAQQSYSGWSDYLNAFLIGRQFYASDINFSSSRSSNTVSYITSLLYSRKSPLLKLEWNHKLFEEMDEKGSVRHI